MSEQLIFVLHSANFEIDEKHAEAPCQYAVKLTSRKLNDKRQGTKVISCCRLQLPWLFGLAMSEPWWISSVYVQSHRTCVTSLLLLCPKDMTMAFAKGKW